MLEGGKRQRLGKGSQRREAPRPEVSKVVGENKLNKTTNSEEFVMMFKVNGQKQGGGGFRSLNLLRATTAEERGLQDVKSLLHR